MAVGDISKLIIRVVHLNQQIRPGLHFEHTLAAQTPAALVTAWITSAEPALLATMAANATIVGYDVEDKRPGTLATYRQTHAPARPGTVVGDALPPQDAVVFGFKSALKSRRARGRVYWPGVAEANQVDGGLVPAAGTLYNTLADAISTNFVGTTPPSAFRLVNFSPEQLVAPPPLPTFVPRPGVVVTPVSSIAVDPTIRSQRRRQIGRGQ